MPEADKKHGCPRFLQLQGQIKKPGRAAREAAGKGLKGQGESYVRRHEKASTAGSTKRQAKGLGRFLRGAAATRGPSSSAAGSSAPALKRLALPLAVLAVLVFAASAGATKTHLFKEAFGSAAQPSFSGARGIAVDQSSGDVLVMDAGGTPSIKRYNPDGTAANFSGLGTNAIDGKGNGECATVPADCDQTPQNGLGFASANESQIAVDNSGTATDGDIYVTQSSPNAINIFSSQGKYLGQLTGAGATNFSEACGVAVDPTGALYVGDYGSGIHKFVPAANPPLNADNTANFSSTTNPCTLAAGAGSSVGFLFAAQYSGPISKLDSGTGEVKYTVSTDANTTVSVDPGSGHVYAATSGGRVKEFDASGAASATSVSSFTLSGGNVQGVAARASGGDVYVSRTGSSSNLEVFAGALATIPEVTTGSATEIAQTAATLNGTVNPDGALLSECKFEYGTTSAYGQSQACDLTPAEIGTGTSPVAVKADISGLTLGATYHFRLIAKNPEESSNGEDQTFKTLSPPAIAGQWAGGVTYTEASLSAQINPEGFATTYKFEWGPTTAYGNSSTQSGVGSDKANHTVSAFLSALQPASTYHYRVIATNSIGTSEGPDHLFTTYAHLPANTDCPNQEFRTGPAATLPDCRGYEMVSPVDKNGGEIRTAPSLGSATATAFTQASQDGEKITYSSLFSFGDEPSGHYSNQYLASRGADGWITHGINPPQSLTVFNPIFVPFIEFNPYFQYFNEDLSSGWFEDFNKAPLMPDAQAGYMNFYRRDNTDGSLETITVNPPLTPTPNTLGYGAVEAAEIQGVSRDGAHTVFAARAKFTPDASAEEPRGISRQLYDFSGGELHLVSILPDGTASAAESNSLGVRNSGFYRDGQTPSRHNTVSADGSRIFWTAADATDHGRIYVRLDGATTIPVSAANAEWWNASTDGSKALYSEGSLFGGKASLKEFDVDSETTTTITDEAYGVAGASEDLSYIYFASNEALDTGASAGEPNLYLYHEGAVSFIATLAVSDVDVVRAEPVYHAARVTPDGRHIAFQSTRSLSGYDNTDALSGKPAMEAYIYDADGEQLSCPSCNPSGARPVGQPLRKAFTVIDELEGFKSEFSRWAAAWLTTEEESSYSSHVLSDDGNRLFFNAFDALVPEDTNGAQDVYEWEAQGSGDCQKPGGCLSLISTGQSPKSSAFMDASPNGSDVFFETAASIDPQDPGGIDIYDARIGGGFPTPSQPTPCIGDACQSPPAAPNDPTPASAGFKGAGDLKPRHDCSSAAKRAAKLSRAAKQLRSEAGKAASGAQAKRLRRSAERLERKAKGIGKSAARCRRSHRGAGR